MQKCEILSNFVPDVKQIIWNWLAGMGLRVKTAVNLARQLRKCTGYMLPSLVYPTISSTKLASAFDTALGERGRGHAIILCSAFLSIALAAHSCSESVWAAALVVHCSDAMFCQFLELELKCCIL